LGNEKPFLPLKDSSKPLACNEEEEEEEEEERKPYPHTSHKFLTPQFYHNQVTLTCNHKSPYP
jgi:hypothetical protein